MDEDQEKEVKRQLLEKWIRQREDLTRLIEALQRELGESVPNISQVANSVSGSTDKQSPPQTIRADAFFGMSQTDAAYSYLKKVGHAVHIDQILELLQAGGVKISGRNPKANLYTALVRGTKRFVLVSPGTFGLAEFYQRKG